MESIFDVFQQADGSASREFEGVGLGLSISRQIARQMNGDVWAESEVGKGSVFHFTAWMEKSKQEQEPAHETTPGQLSGKKILEGENNEDQRNVVVTRYSITEEDRHSVHILLAEDNPINRKLATMMLTKAGYRVSLAENGQEAVDMFTSDPDAFDLIFMDIRMPRMNGLEATGLIREKGYKDIPIIAMTAQTMKGDREKCIDAGMNDYIAKPIKRETIFEMVKKWRLDRS